MEYLKCVYCGKKWNVSALAVYRGWYRCPECEARAYQRRRQKQMKVRSEAMDGKDICLYCRVLWDPDRACEMDKQLEKGIKPSGPVTSCSEFEPTALPERKKHD